MGQRGRRRVRQKAFENPLKDRFKEEFEKMPTTPGVYKFYGLSTTQPRALKKYLGKWLTKKNPRACEQVKLKQSRVKEDVLLYVGKAKNLRARLRSYARVTPENASTKVTRLVVAASRIEWELCESEAHALIRENELLRTFSPPFNRMNTRPHTYEFIAVKPLGSQVTFRVTRDLTSKTEQEFFFGAFKSRARVRDGMFALFRLLWLTQTNESITQGRSARIVRFPSALLRVKLPSFYTTDIEPETVVSLLKFLRGSDHAFIEDLTETLLQQELIPTYTYPQIQADLQTLNDLWVNALRKNCEMLDKHAEKLDSGADSEPGIIPQERLDDIFVHEWVLKGRVSGKIEPSV